MKKSALASPSIIDIAPRTSWVKLKKYAELTGDSAAAVHARRRAGKWRDGTQCKIIDESLWINLPAVETWLANWGNGVQPV